MNKFSTPKQKTNNNFAKSGFTLIEMAITIAVIVMVSVMVYANYQEINERGELLSISQKIKNDINLAQDYSLNSMNHQKQTPEGWGISLNRNSNDYTVFADFDGDKYHSYPTVLLIHGSEEPSAGTFTESSNYGKTITVTGATRNSGQGALSTMSDGYWSFDGDDYLSAATSSDFEFANQDFTLDFWFQPASTGTERVLLAQGNTNTSYYLTYDSAQTITFGAYVSSTEYKVTSTTTVGTTSWAHIGAVRHGDLILLFIDGEPEGITELPASASLDTYNEPLLVGNGPMASGFNGTMDEVRVSKGTARWFEQFIPWTEDYLSDDEGYKTVTLPPGIVFEKLRQGTTGLSSLDLYFSNDDYNLYAQGTTASATIILNKAGAEDTNSSADNPITLSIDQGGAVSWSN